MGDKDSDKKLSADLDSEDSRARKLVKKARPEAPKPQRKKDK